MSDRTPQKVPVCSNASTTPDNPKNGANRRQFLGRVGMAAGVAATGALSGVPAAFANTAGKGAGNDRNLPPTGGYANRVQRAYNLRVNRATADSKLVIPPHTTNGDEARYSDKSASYSKGLLQDDIGLVNPDAWVSFKKALASASMTDWENIIIGGTRTQNGPQGSYAFDLETADSAQYGNAPFFNDPNGLPAVPPFDQITSPQFGAQLIEMYWGSLLRDVAFTDYANNATAQAAAAELSALGPVYRGPRDGNGQVTPDLLFRGTFPGETIGPYMSQFMISPTQMSTQAINQLYFTNAAGVDYMTDPVTFLQVQNGQSTGQNLQQTTTAYYLHDGRGLAALTHGDYPPQEYMVALFCMTNNSLVFPNGVPLNPGNPYINSRTQNGFCTFGGPDFVQSMSEVTSRALQKVWFQKWLVHLTLRPESGAAILRQIMQGLGGTIQATLNNNVLNSQAVQQSFSKYGDYFLSQAFPEGSPTHPSYPTGHGTAAGAAITVLKFFFDGSFVVPNPMVPSSDGTTLQPYTGGDAGQITVNGELNKLARNVSFGHGVHAGIHWRTDTDYSMTLGEAMALSYLQNKAITYNEKFTVQIQRLDGSTATISNQ